VSGRIAVLVSGRGSNLEAILRAVDDGSIDGRVVAVLSNRPNCRALEVARRAGVPTVAAFTLADHGDSAARDRAMAETLQEAGSDLVVTAGYDRVLDEAFVSAFPGRILNIHPSLLPAFAGTMHAIEDALKAGVAETGVTVHLIEPRTVDAGTIVAQAPVAIRPDDTVDTLSERVHAAEHKLLPEVIQAWIHRA
jgi:phosphoribosylglycinamide formyltransferase-1